MERDYIPVIRRSESSKVYLKRIMLIEQELRKIMIFTEEGKYWRYGKIEELSKYLDKRFLKCHSSCIINMDKVVKMRDQTIYFENGYKIIICKEKFYSAKNKFNGYLETTNENA